MDLDKCQFVPKSPADADVGCPLDHCPKGHHTVERGYGDDGESRAVHEDGGFHPECWAQPPCSCPDEVEKLDDLCVVCRDEAVNSQVRAAERAAGWDPSP
jgi:hypothetical protein